MLKNNEIIENIIMFVNENSESLLDRVASDLNINVDFELSQLHDMVTEKYCPVSFEEIVIATRQRIIISIASFLEKN